MIVYPPYFEDQPYQPVITQTVDFEYSTPKSTLSARTIESARIGTYTSLYHLLLQCSSAGWDGFDAIPIEWAVYARASAVIASLPWRFPMPSAGAEPDGHITLEWYISPDKLLSVSIGRDGLLHYAAVIGQARHYGVEPQGEMFPSTIKHLIRRILPE